MVKSQGTNYIKREGWNYAGYRSTVYDVVKNYVTEKIGKFTGAEVIAACPIGSRSAVLNAFNKLTKEEIIVKCGSGRGTFYVRKDAMENENLPQQR